VKQSCVKKSIKNIQNLKKNKIDENETRNSLKNFEFRESKFLAEALTSNISCQI